MRPIGYAAPTSVEDAVALLARHGPRARMFAGGTDLITQVRERMRATDVFVDAKRIPELGTIAFRDDGGLIVGAAVPCCRIHSEERIAARYPALSDAARIIGGIAIQSRASFGGNLCNSSPAGDSIPGLIVHQAVCTVAGVAGRRELAVELFCTGPGQNALRPGELLVSLSLPPARPGSGAAHVRFTPRAEMDIAVASAAAFVALEGDRIVGARVAIGAVAPTPLLVLEAGEHLMGKRLSDDVIERAGEIARSASRPISDMRGTADHRRQLVAVLVERALGRAAERAMTSGARPER